MHDAYYLGTILRTRRVIDRYVRKLDVINRGLGQRSIP
jgi:hypothetical protein